jgi:hypothetical protein
MPLRQIDDYHNLSNYVREPYQTPGVAATVDVIESGAMENSCLMPEPIQMSVTTSIRHGARLA